MDVADGIADTVGRKDDRDIPFRRALSGCPDRNAVGPEGREHASGNADLAEDVITDKAPASSSPWIVPTIGSAAPAVVS